jgi:hypothetical protein
MWTEMSLEIDPVCEEDSRQAGEDAKWIGTLVHKIVY